MSDIAKSFTYLQDTIPQWLSDIANIQEKITRMQDDIARVSVSQSPFVKGKTGSVESIRAGKLDAAAEEATPSAEALMSPLGSRKRKSPSIMSSRASGPSRYRPRTMVVVRYDGDMQKSFENLVRGLATGRNMLRKAKMEAKMAELAAIAGSSEDEDDDDEEEDIMSNISYRPRMASMRIRAAARRGGRNGLNGGPPPSLELFETTDKTLEQAQELCEKSAHLTLRDGDCRTEVKLAQMHLENVLSVAKTEATKCSASQPQSVEVPHDQDTSDTSVSSMEPSYKRHSPNISAPKPLSELEAKLEPIATSSTVRPPTATTSTAPKTMDIEVDDDDEDEDMDFVMPPVRFTSRRTARA